MILRQSLLELLQTKPVAKITVTEVCERANINRATFYAHYTDPSDLMRSIENELIDGITSRVIPALSAGDAGLRRAMTGIFDYIRENAETCRTLLSDAGDASFQGQIVRVMEEQYVAYLKSASPDISEDAEYVYTFIALGSVGVIKRWLNDGMQKSSEEIADLILKLSASGMSMR